MGSAAAIVEAIAVLASIVGPEADRTRLLRAGVIGGLVAVFRTWLRQGDRGVHP